MTIQYDVTFFERVPEANKATFLANLLNAKGDGKSTSATALALIDTIMLSN